MHYRVLGNTGLYVSELCLGAMTFGGKGMWTAIGEQPQETVDQLVGLSLDSGINFIDTANIYSFGLSETLLGNALKGKRGQVVLATKVRGRMGPEANEEGLSRRHIMQQVEDSLKRLQTDYIDLYQIHGYDPLTPLEETLRTLDDLVHQGKVRYIGASNLFAWQLMKSLGISRQEGLARFESLQSYYTIAGRDLEREIIPLLKDQKVGLMVWSPLAGGFLTGKYQRNQESDSSDRRSKFDFPPINKDKAYNIIETIEPIAQRHEVSVASIALAWLLHQETVTSVIIGAKKISQFHDNLTSLEVEFSAEELKQLDEVSSLPSEYPEWMFDMLGRERPAKGNQEFDNQ